MNGTCRWNRLRWLVASFLVLAAVGAGSTATAQERPEVDVQTFEPALGPHAIFTVHQTGTLPHLAPGGELVFDYLSAPVVEDPAGASTRSLVDQQLALDVLGGIGITDRGQIAVHLPLYLVNDVEIDGEGLGGATAGDLRLTPKYQFISRQTGPVGFGAAVDVSLPTGDGAAFAGAPTAGVEPKLLVDAGFGNTIVAANVGADFRGADEFRNIELGSQLTYSLGVEQEIVDGTVDLGGELYGSTPFSDFFSDTDTSPLEGILGAKVRTNAGVVLMAGGGGGLVPGIGAPEFRAFLGVSYPDKQRDADGDGIDDGDDECPQKPEDLDGYEDSDGCPDPDNDGDGIPDDRDKCPGEPEDQDGDRDGDGCPDEEQSESEPDSDGDGIPDSEDECPDEAEDDDGFQDEDGCPDTDNDGDGIADADDECPGEAEDEDGFQDEDGCPDTDNDGDGVVDAEDECRDEAGLESNDGCPPEEKKAVRKEDEIEILENVQFKTEKAELQEKSFDILDQVAYILEQNPDIERVMVEGHTDDTGGDRFNQQLSEERATAVKDYLVEERQIDAGRLETKGFGSNEPLVPNSSEENRRKNRRVEFKIAEKAEKGAETSEQEEASESDSASGGSDDSADGEASSEE